MRIVLAVLVCGVLAGCHGDLWFDPDDPGSVDLAVGDVRAGMATAADLLLTAERVPASDAQRLGFTFEALARAIRERTTEAAEKAIDEILETVSDPGRRGLYQRLNDRVMERVEARLRAMDTVDGSDAAFTAWLRDEKGLTDEALAALGADERAALVKEFIDTSAGGVGRRLTIAALEGVAQGCFDYAVTAPDEG